MFQRPSISLGTVAHGSARGLPATLTAIALAAVLTACGGGGGSSGGSDVVAVTIQTQPTEQTVVANGVARFTVQATGDGLAIQWQRSTDAGASWSDISGATSSVLELSNVVTTQDGYQFRANVSGKSGAVTSSAVVLHVSSVAVVPSFTVDLSSPASITAGGNVSLNVTAAGTSLTYQWQSSTDGGATWANVSGGNAATLALQAVPLTANGTLYRVQISNSASTATSQTATLTVTAASAIPAITTQPQAVSVTAPNPATFTVAGSGNPTPTVQWQLSTDGGVNYTDISGATAATYSTGATSLSQNNYRYRAVLTNSAGSVNSSAVALSVQTATVAPTITTAPANATVTAGATATFTIAASGTPSPTIQWQLSTDSGGTWSNITGATSASYTTAALTTADTGKRYRAVVTNSAGTVTSAVATLTVNAAVSALAGHSWRAGALIEGSVGDPRPDANTSLDTRLGISDDGVATVLYVKNTAKLYSFMAARRAAGTSSVEPAWDTPVTLDTTARINPQQPYGLAVSPNGNAVAIWTSSGICQDGVTSGCSSIYASRRFTNAIAWETPIKVAQSTGTPVGARTPLLSNSGNYASPYINDKGDIAIMFLNQNNFLNPNISFALRASGEPIYRVENLSTLNSDYSYISAGLDKNSQITVIGFRVDVSFLPSNLGAYHGSVASGFGNNPIVESVQNDSTIVNSLINTNFGIDGHAAALWRQGATTLISVRDPGTGQWSIRDMTADVGSSSSSGYKALTISDGPSGDISIYNGCSVVRRINSIWQTKQSLPAGCSFNIGGMAPFAMDRNGNYIGWVGTRWGAYDATSNAMIKAIPAANLAVAADYVLGTNAYPYVTGLDPINMVLSPKGYGVATVRSWFSTLPSPALPNGAYVADPSIYNMWGLYFK